MEDNTENPQISPSGVAVGVDIKQQGCLLWDKSRHVELYKEHSEIPRHCSTLRHAVACHNVLWHAANPTFTFLKI